MCICVYIYLCTYLCVYLYGYLYGAHIPRSVCVCICISHIHTYMHTYIRVHICSCSHARFASDSDPSTGKYDGKVESGLCVGFRTGPRGLRLQVGWRRGFRRGEVLVGTVRLGILNILTLGCRPRMKCVGAFRLWPRSSLSFVMLQWLLVSCHGSGSE